MKEGSPSRVIISGVRPEVDAGRFPAKRAVGDLLHVEADIFCDGHEQLAGVVMHRRAGKKAWVETALEPLVNDRWRASVPVGPAGAVEYTVEAWVDRFATWRDGLTKKIAAGQDVSVDLEIGSSIVADTAARATGADAMALKQLASAMRTDQGVEVSLGEQVAALTRRYADRSHAARYDKVLRALVDRERARFSSWYEFFPRSAGAGGAHGTFRDAADRLEYVARLGFDVAYLPPIHPIGRTKRKGPNNAPDGAPDAAGSPWAIGSEDGGHDAVNPDLGTLEDFDAFVARAGSLGIEVALDLAFQCSPDHPYVRKHPEWFKHRPDGSIQYAENPPKRYEDIYPLDFECENWRELWEELRSVVEHWIAHGVRIFRVDNPHTKPFAFWEWLIADVQGKHPDVLFLSEAFTRPKIMYHLAKIGFTQSYTYFAWRNSAWELREYLTEVTQTEVADFFRPNLWPNTPDILNEYLQHGGRPAFMIRLVLAATLGASYGIYGPPFELAEHVPVAPGKEEYLDSEKYQLRAWDLESTGSLAELIERINAIRKENPSLQRNDTLRFWGADNPNLLVYSKASLDGDNVILCVVNVDPHNTQSGTIWAPAAELGADPGAPYGVHDLVSGAHYVWQGDHNFVELNPHVFGAHVLLIQGRPRSEQDFEPFA